MRRLGEVVLHGAVEAARLVSVAVDSVFDLLGGVSCGWVSKHLR